MKAPAKWLRVGLGLTLAAAMALPGTALADVVPSTTGTVTGPSVTLNGRALRFLDVQPTFLNSKVMVPVRRIAELMGAKVEVNGKEITLTKGDKVVVLFIDSATAYVNGQPFTLPQPATLVDYRTLVPVREIFEALGANVAWDQEQKLATITMPEGVKDPAALALLQKYSGWQTQQSKAIQNVDFSGNLKFELTGPGAEEMRQKTPSFPNPFAITLKGSVRAEDMLMQMTMPNPMMPLLGEMKVELARKAKQMYANIPFLTEGWTMLPQDEQPTDPTTTLTPAAQAELLGKVLGALDRAELGKQETVGGVAHQWVHFSINPEKIVEVLAEQAGEAPPYFDDELYFTAFDVSLLINPANGEQAKMRLNLLIMADHPSTPGTILVEGESNAARTTAGGRRISFDFTIDLRHPEVPMGINMTGEFTETPNTAPIPWPTLPTTPAEIDLTNLP